jgi:hypothetical protein
MILIHPPQYTKITHPQTRVIEACYTFRVTMDESEEQISPISFLVEEPSTLVSSMIASCLEENRIWWEGFLRLFLERSSKFFSKAYTVQQLLPIITHTFAMSNAVSDTVSGPSTVILSPKSIQIRGGTFCVFWEHECESLVIDIPVGTLPVDPEISELSEHSEPECSALSNLSLLDPSVPVDLEEFPLQEIPLSSTENAARLHDRQKAKEARLKAKLAIYRAQTEMNEYYDKYGTDLSDSDASDSDTESVSSQK